MCQVPWVSQHFPAQLRGPEALAQRLQARARVARDGAPLQDTAAADALLLVSGSHALRPVLSWTGALQVSVGPSHAQWHSLGLRYARIVTIERRMTWLWRARCLLLSIHALRVALC